MNNTYFEGTVGLIVQAIIIILLVIAFVHERSATNRKLKKYRSSVCELYDRDWYFSFVKCLRHYCKDIRIEDTESSNMETIRSKFADKITGIYLSNTVGFSMYFNDYSSRESKKKYDFTVAEKLFGKMTKENVFVMSAFLWFIEQESTRLLWTTSEYTDYGDCLTSLGATLYKMRLAAIYLISDITKNDNSNYAINEIRREIFKYENSMIDKGAKEMGMTREQYSLWLNLKRENEIFRQKQALGLIK